MSAEKRWRLICYDIRDEKRYRKVFKVVRGTGWPVQYSIFRARLDDRETEQLRWELARLMAPEDALLIVDLCPRCARNVVSRNHVEGWDEEEPVFTILAGASGHGPAKAVPEQAPADARGRGSASRRTDVESFVKMGNGDKRGA